MATTIATPDFMPPPEYPVRLDIQRPDTQSRLTNFPLGIGTLIRWVLLIPHLVIIYFLSLIAYLLHFLATFGILFTGKYPAGLYNFIVYFMRWNANITGYTLSLYDKYPSFSGDQGQYPLSFGTLYPETSSRLLNFPILGYLVKLVLIIPHLVVLLFLGIAAVVLVFVAQFAILFTGSFPAGMHRFTAGYLRWTNRNNAYLLGLTDRYPPFSLS